MNKQVVIRRDDIEETVNLLEYVANEPSIDIVARATAERLAKLWGAQIGR